MQLSKAAPRQENRNAPECGAFECLVYQRDDCIPEWNGIPTLLSQWVGQPLFLKPPKGHDKQAASLNLCSLWQAFVCTIAEGKLVLDEPLLRIECRDKDFFR